VNTKNSNINNHKQLTCMTRLNNQDSFNTLIDRPTEFLEINRGDIDDKFGVQRLRTDTRGILLSPIPSASTVRLYVCSGSRPVQKLS